MSYDEYKEFSRKAWDVVDDYLCIDRYRKSDRGRFCICNKSNKNHIQNALLKRQLFY